MSILAYVTGDAPHLLKLRRAKQKNTRRGQLHGFRCCFCPVTAMPLRVQKFRKFQLMMMLPDDAIFRVWQRCCFAVAPDMA